MKKLFLLSVLSLSFLFTSCSKDDVSPKAPIQNPMGYSTVSIGAWDMDSDTYTVVNHFLIDVDKLLSVDVVIYSDSGEKTSLLSDGNYVLEFSTGTIGLTRVNGGYFDQHAFDDSSINRGEINFIFEL